MELLTFYFRGMKLELKHLEAYLPYGLKIYDGQYTRELTIYSTTYDTIQIGIYRLFEKGHYDYAMGLPVFHNLSDLTKEIEVGGERFVPAGKMITHGFHHPFWYELEKFDHRYLYAMDLEKLLEWHFDVFGLIEQGLAIDINTLNQ